MRKSDIHEYAKYATQVRTPEGEFGSSSLRGGPGRGRNHRAAGIENTNHHNPITKSTTRRAKVELFMKRRMTTHTHWRKRAALYPMPIPVAEI